MVLSCCLLIRSPLLGVGAEAVGCFELQWQLELQAHECCTPTSGIRHKFVFPTMPAGACKRCASPANERFGREWTLMISISCLHPMLGMKLI